MENNIIKTKIKMSDLMVKIRNGSFPEFNSSLNSYSNLLSNNDCRVSDSTINLLITNSKRFIEKKHFENDFYYFKHIEKNENGIEEYESIPMKNKRLLNILGMFAFLENCYDESQCVFDKVSFFFENIDEFHNFVKTFLNTDVKFKLIEVKHKSFDICDCACHKPNIRLDHCMPCCDICDTCGENISVEKHSEHIKRCKNK